MVVCNANYPFAPPFSPTLCDKGRHLSRGRFSVLIGWWFASDDTTGLHFRSELFSRVGVSPILGQEFHVAPVVHAETDDDAPALILELGDPVRATEWNALVHELI